MATDLPFRDLEMVEQQLRLAHQRRDMHASQLRAHVDLLKDREHRGLMMKDAVHDLLHSWRPAEVVGAALEPAKGLLPLLIQMATMRGSLKRRVFWTALSVLTPTLLKQVDFGKVFHMVSGLFSGRATVGHNGVHAVDQEEEEEEDFTEPWQ